MLSVTLTLIRRVNYTLDDGILQEMQRVSAVHYFDYDSHRGGGRIIEEFVMLNHNLSVAVPCTCYLDIVTGLVTDTLRIFYGKTKLF